jgi:uncharacterized protein (DUF302 family)
MTDEARTLILAAVMFAVIMAPLLYLLRAVLRFSRSLELVEDDEAVGLGQMGTPSIAYGMATVVAAPFEEGLALAQQALREEGLGVVATVDVAELLEHSGIRFPAYAILTAWDATTMAQVLKVEEAAGLLLPARVLVYAVEGGTAIVAGDPRKLLAVAENPALVPLAGEARAQLERAIGRLEVGTVQVQG